MLVFGGYGGGGTAFGDLWVLHTAEGGLRWEEVRPGGTAPAPRFDHTAAALATVANSPEPDKLVILGGRDSTQSFTDAHVLDLESMEWLAGHGFPPLGGEVRCRDWQCCCGLVEVRPVLMSSAMCTLSCAPGLAAALRHSPTRTCRVSLAGVQPPELQCGHRALPQDFCWLWEELDAAVPQLRAGGEGAGALGV